MEDIAYEIEIRVPVSAKILTITFVGYEQRVIKLKKISKVGTLRLKVNATVLGGIGVTRSFSIRQLYAGLIRNGAQGKLNQEI